MQGFPIPPVPPALFITGEDISKPDGTVTCQPIGTLKALRLAAQGVRILARLIELV